METIENKCLLADKCKVAGKQGICNITCYPYVLAHGTDNGGFFNATGIPVKYRTSFLKTLPIEKANPQAYALAEAYVTDVLSYVNDGVGLFLYSVPNAQNKLGTGTGKTTMATALGNEYLKARIIEHASGKKLITNQPTFYVRVAEFQNTYNKQFRGGFDEQEEATTKVNKMMKKMQKSELLILDDVSLRASTEAFTNLFYEILDERYINEKPIIFTSNFPIEKIGETLNPQIQSRIEGMTEQVAFKGTDFRKGGILNARK